MRKRRRVGDGHANRMRANDNAQMVANNTNIDDVPINKIVENDLVNGDVNHIETDQTDVISNDTTVLVVADNANTDNVDADADTSTATATAIATAIATSALPLPHDLSVEPPTTIAAPLISDDNDACSVSPAIAIITTTATATTTADLGVVDAIAIADPIEQVALSPVIVPTTKDSSCVDLLTKEHFKCIPDHLLAPLRERAVPDRAALLDAAIRCAPCTASLLALVDWPAGIYHDNTPTLTAPASAYAMALAWRERCDALALLASLTHSLAVDQREIVMRGGSSARAAFAHLRERYTNEATGIASTAMPTLLPAKDPPPPPIASTTTTRTRNMFRCGSIVKTLDFEAMRDLRDGSSIRASLVDCYFEYCITEKYPDARKRVFCMAAAYAQQLVGARMYDGGQDILFVIESVRTQMAMRESQSGTTIELLLMPVALPGHVTLLGVHFVPNMTTLVYIDSMNGTPPRGLFAHMTTLLGERAVNVQTKLPHVPFQYGSDCGLHTMFYGEQFISCICRGKDLSTFGSAKPETMAQFRRDVFSILNEHCS